MSDVSRFVATRAARALVALVALAGAASGATQQAAPRARPTELRNGGMEEADAEGQLAGWFVAPALVDAGYWIGAEQDDVFEGELAARIDSREADVANRFGNLLQSIDATPYRGKQVRFRAAVKLADGAGHAQMWLRVDLAPENGQPRMGFFDNMGGRPIATPEWTEHEIVGGVAEDAQAIVLGVMTIGQCLVLVDAATLEVAGDDVAPTGGDDDVLARAPIQAFVTPWLLVPLAACALFALGFLAPGRVGRFAFAFTCAYWTLYALPTLVQTLVPRWGGLWGLELESTLESAARWTARSVLGIEGHLVSSIQNGSGDTTSSYVQALVSLALALAVAALASAVEIVRRRPASAPARGRDLLRSVARYYLAAVLIGYGLAKLGAVYNQFSPPGMERLASTYGSSSPMGLLWTFLGASRPYTAFGGLAETVAGFLLLWRRTALLGALAAATVMLNVALMNFCYDVPVKLFSAHLVVLACCIALRDLRRLGHVFLGLAPAAEVPAAPAPPRRRVWLHRAAKAYLVTMVFVLPAHGRYELQSSVAGALPALGDWKLARLEADGSELEPRTGEIASLTLVARPTRVDDHWTTSYYATLVGGSSAYGTATITPERLELDGPAGGPSRVVPGSFAWSREGDELRLESATLRASFAPAGRDFLLVRRGFRWINEGPFNR